MSVPHSRGPAHEVERAGGAYVRRRMPFGDRDLGPGDTLTAREVASIPRANLNALINTGKLELWPAAPGAQGVSGPLERVAVHIGAGRYVVIEGRKITDEPVNKAEADALVAGVQAAQH